MADIKIKEGAEKKYTVFFRNGEEWRFNAYTYKRGGRIELVHTGELEKFDNKGNKL